MGKPAVKNKRTLSFRAECEHDVRLLFEAILAEGFMLKRSIDRSQMFPDVRVEITTSANLEEIMAIMRTIPDSHVMMQTLRAVPLNENSLEREFPVF